MDRVELAGGHLEYRWVSGDDERPPLVFLHDGLGCVATWEAVPQALAAATRARALSYSRFGYGGSAPLASARTARFLHDEALVVLPDLLSRLGVRVPVLVGHSDGASIALIHAASHPVTALILEAPHVFAEDATLAGVASIRDRFAAEDELRRKYARYHPDPAIVVSQWAAAWLSPAFRAWSIEPLLASIACPVLLLQAENDPYGSLEHVRLIEKRTRGLVRTVILPGDGHTPHRDCHARVLEEMCAFLAALVA